MEKVAIKGFTKEATFAQRMEYHRRWYAWTLEDSRSMIEDMKKQALLFHELKGRELARTNPEVAAMFERLIASSIEIISIETEKIKKVQNNWNNGVSVFGDKME